MISSPTKTKLPVALLAVALFLCLALLAPAGGQDAIKVGIVGLDAHAVPWTQIIHKPGAPAPISGMRIVAAVPAGSPDIPFSVGGIEKNTAAMRELGVEICESIDAMLPKVDAVMLLGIDGRPHLAQARTVFATKKPVFIDKPVAASLAESVVIFEEAAESGTPCFSNSALRYGPLAIALTNDPKIGRILGCDAFSGGKSILPGHPDLFYYGIHGTELLFRIMGPGCKTVARAKAGTADFVTGTWSDGRLGTFRGILQGGVGYGATAFGEKGIGSVTKFEGYEPLLVEIAKFFKTGVAPMTVEDTLEIYAFLEGADESAREGGKPVSIDNVLSRARREAGALRKR